MKYSVIEINGHIVYFDNKDVGLILLTHSKDNTELTCMVSKDLRHQEQLYFGDRINIKVLASESENSLSNFKFPGSFRNGAKVTFSSKREIDNFGFHTKFRTRVISSPAISGGVLSILLTINRGRYSLRIGGITNNNDLIDYLDETFISGDEIDIELADLKGITEPTRF